MMATLVHTRPRWDALVRLTHWGIAIGVIANRLLIEGGSGLHIWIGYAVGALLALRLLWGSVGSASARFASFLPDPSAAIAHIRDIKAGRMRVYPSHNPLGALMVYALWAMLIIVVATGIAMASAHSVISPNAQAAEAAYALPTPAAAEEENESRGEHEEESMLGETHELAANLLLALAVLHVAGVALEVRRGDRGLVRAMISGRADHD